MTPPTTIRVLEDHIVRGEPENCEKCPIALALLAQVADPLAWVEVSESEISVHFPGVDYTAQTPTAASEFIDAFDDDDEDRGVRPFEFTIAWTAFDYDDLTERTS